MSRKYKSSKLSLIKYFIAAIFVSLLVFAVLAFILSNILNVNQDYVYGPAAIVTYFVISIILSTYFTNKKNHTIIINEEGINLYNGRRIYKSFPKNQYVFSSFIESEINGLGKHTSRYLRVSDVYTGYFKDYCLLIKHREFEELIALTRGFNDLLTNDENHCDSLITNKSTKALKQNDQVERFSINNRETIKEEADKVVKKNSKATIIICLLVLGSYIALAGFYAPEFSATLTGAVGLIVFILIPACLLSIIPTYLSYKPALKLMPKDIFVDQNKIIIDYVSYYFKDLRQIKMTPASYNFAIVGKNKIQRMLTIIKEDGSKKQYFLGFRPGLKKFETMVFEDYELLCKALEEKFQDNPEKLTYEL